MAKLAVFGCLEKYLFTLFCFELRKAQKSHCAIKKVPKEALSNGLQNVFLKNTINTLPPFCLYCQLTKIFMIDR